MLIRASYYGACLRRHACSPLERTGSGYLSPLLCCCPRASLLRHQSLASRWSVVEFVEGGAVVLAQEPFVAVVNAPPVVMVVVNTLVVVVVVNARGAVVVANAPAVVVVNATGAVNVAVNGFVRKKPVVVSVGRTLDRQRDREVLSVVADRRVGAVAVPVVLVDYCYYY